MTSNTKKNITPELSPSLAALRDSVLAGGPINRERILNAIADGYMQEWRAQRKLIEAEQEAADRASWTDELARFISNVLASDESGLFARDVTFVTDPEQVATGVPTILVEAASAVEHSGTGTASGKVKLTMLNGAKVADPNFGTRRLAAILQPHSRTVVQVGNSPHYGAQSTGWVLSLPVVENPTAAGLAGDLKRALEGLPVQYDPITEQTVVARGVSVDCAIGKSELVSVDGDTVVVRGHLLVQSSGTNQVGQSVAYTNEELTTEARKVLDRLTKTSGFVVGLGVVVEATLEGTDHIVRDNGPALGIRFLATAKARVA